MKAFNPINFKEWIDKNRSLLKPPVGNKMVWEKTDDFIVMVVGGPNSRTDYHYNETEEFFYMLEGDMVLRVQENGKAVDIPIKEGEIFLLPAKVPHSPQRPANSIGLVIERIRDENHKDGLQWYCTNCNHKIYDEYFQMVDIVGQMQPVFKRFYSSEEARTCEKCGTVMGVPEKA